MWLPRLGHGRGSGNPGGGLTMGPMQSTSIAGVHVNRARAAAHYHLDRRILPPVQPKLVEHVTETVLLCAAISGLHYPVTLATMRLSPLHYYIDTDSLCR